jgi:hypothetical protein
MSMRCNKTSTRLRLRTQHNARLLTQHPKGCHIGCESRHAPVASAQLIGHARVDSRAYSNKQESFWCLPLQQRVAWQACCILEEQLNQKPDVICVTYKFKFQVVTSTQDLTYRHS